MDDKIAGTITAEAGPGADWEESFARRVRVGEVVVGERGETPVIVHRWGKSGKEVVVIHLNYSITR
jgi:hypothetical protein